MRRLINESFADTITSSRTTRHDRGHLTILDAMADENLFAPYFHNAESWVAWRAFFAVLFGYPLDEQQRELFRQCTGRERINSEGHHEAWMVIGRRGGKSFALALIAVFLACCAAKKSTSKNTRCWCQLWCAWRSASASIGVRRTSRPRCRNTSNCTPSLG
jgi:hypothetical protein